MEKPLVVPPIKIDLSIRRGKKKFNQRQHLFNIAGENFEIPKTCSKSHNNARSRFQCAFLTEEDAIIIRNQLYKDPDKNLLIECLRKWIELIPPKRHTATETSTSAKLMTMFYKLHKEDGTQVTVCREMFLNATGLTKSRFQTLVKKLYKKKLLENDKTIHPITKKSQSSHKMKRIQELLNKKQEKILSIQSGKFNEFSKLLKNDNCNPEQSPPGTIDVFELEPVELSNDRILLDLDDLMLVCRICLRNFDTLHKITEISSVAGTEHKIADLIEMITDNANLPNKICDHCLEKIKISYLLKVEWNESQEIIQDNLKKVENGVSRNLNDFIVTDEIYEETADEKNSIVVNMEEKFNEILKTPPTSRILRIDQTKVTSEKCYLCNVEYETTAEKHFEMNHAVIETSKCTECQFETEFPWFLNLHYQLHKDDFNLCQNCGKRFDSRTRFYSHTRWCHQKSQKAVDRLQFKCQECDACYLSKKSLEIHEMHQHSPMQDKPFKCTNCNASFYRKVRLRQHLLMHGETPNFQCEFCSKGFIVRYRLLMHQEKCKRKFESK